MTFPYEVTIPLLKDIRTEAPQATCEIGMGSEAIVLLVKRTVATFDNAELRRAMALTLDRKSFIDILGQGEGEIGGALLPPPDGVWGMPTERLQTLPGYSGDTQKNRGEAQAIMRKLGYGRDRRLTVTVSARNLAVYRDPAAILIDQLKEIYIDGELETVETANWVPKLMRKDYKVGLNVLGTAVDDPDVYFSQNYVCSSARNYMGYCDKEFDKMVEQQSMEAHPGKRKKLACDADYALQQDLACPIIYGSGVAFSSGADVHQRQLRKPEESREHRGPQGWGANSGDLLTRSVNWKPVSAAPHGYAMGLALGIVLECDLIVAAAGTKFQVTETSRGLGGSKYWALLNFRGGAAFPNQVALTGRFFTAEEALAAGLINLVAPDGQHLQ